MNFCEHCGHKLKPDAQFCRNCGAQLIIDARAAQDGHAHPPYTQPGNVRANSNPLLRNKKGIGIAAIVIAAIILFNFLPKKMNEPEYMQFSIEQLAGFGTDYYRFREYVYDSDIDLDERDYSVAEGKALVKPAKEFQKTINQRYKDLNKVKPPNLYKQDHENLLNGLSSYEKAMAAFISYLETGSGNYEDIYDHHEEMADSYLENSVFASDLFEEKLEEKYKQLMGW